jgi:cation transporter-like permease
MHEELPHNKHWHYLYERRRRRVNVLGISAKQMAWSQVFSLIGSIIAGVLLESNKVTLTLIAGVLVVLPGVFDLDGSLGAALSAKINHKLENDSSSAWKVLIESVSYGFMVACLAGILVAGLGASLGAILFEADFQRIFMVAFGAITLSAIVGFPLIGIMSIMFRKYRVNPDDVVGPIESSIFDILTIVTLTFMVKVLT